jgi:hypothetical protein
MEPFSPRLKGPWIRKSAYPESKEAPFRGPMDQNKGGVWPGGVERYRVPADVDRLR